MNTISNNNKSRYSDIDGFNYLKRPHHRRRLNKVLNIISNYINRYQNRNNLKLLSLGAGHGSFESYLKKQFNLDVTASDFSDPVIKKIQENNIRGIKLDLSKKFSSIENESFDIIFAGEVIEHLFDTQLFLSECYRCLKSGGILIITTPNLARIHDRIKFLFGYSPRQIDPNNEYLKLHIRPFTWGVLRHNLKLVGFKNTKVTSHAFEVISTVTWGQIPFLGAILPTLSPTLIVTAKKLT